MKRRASGRHVGLRAQAAGPARKSSAPTTATRAAAAARTTRVARPANSLVGRTLATDVMHRLRGDIIACTLLPGTRLRFEALRSVYHVSFSTLREGLSRLASEGLVVADGQRGFRVAPVSMKEMMDLAAARVLVEREAMRMAVSNNAPAWRTRVMSAFQRMDQLPEQRSTSPAWAAAHAEFHDALASGCDSPVLQEIRAKLFDRAHRYRRLAAAYRSYPRSNAGEHREIMEAALAPDVERACQLIQQHIQRTSSDVAALDAAMTSAAADPPRLFVPDAVDQRADPAD